LAAAGAVVEDRRMRLSTHETSRPADDPHAARLELASIDESRERVRRQFATLDHRTRTDDEARTAIAGLEPERTKHREVAQIWQDLDEVIGSANGLRFQAFAQSLTLELLVRHANAHLRDLAPRYSLQRVPEHNLELQLIDHDLGDEVRSVQSLSGGETFLVSLGLALGLSSIAAEDQRVDSLFIDEGFGSLDAQALDAAISTLDALQAHGRQIGIVSHVVGLAERIGVEVRVEPVSPGRSRLRVFHCSPEAVLG
jgi:exonuclease SbcC